MLPPANLPHTPDPAARAFDLAVLDLDGTVLAHDGTISDAVRRAIADVEQRGVIVTLATGRTLDYVRAHDALLGLTAPVVTSQGAVIGDPVSGHLLHEWCIGQTAARRMAQWVDEQDRLCCLFFNDDDGHTHIYQNLPTVGDGSAAETAMYDHIMGTPRHVVGPLLPLLAAQRHANGAARDPIKFMLVSDRAHEPALPGELAQRFDASLTFTRTHPLLVEATAPGIDKGAGVLHLCALLGIAPARVLAMGDNDNDISMFGVVGAAVAMRGGSAAALAAAHWAAPAIEAEGAALALRALLLDDRAALATLQRVRPAAGGQTALTQGHN